jgi:hypothetical protein
MQSNCAVVFLCICCAGHEESSRFVSAMTPPRRQRYHSDEPTFVPWNYQWTTIVIVGVLGHWTSHNRPIVVRIGVSTGAVMGLRIGPSSSSAAETCVFRGGGHGPIIVGRIILSSVLDAAALWFGGVNGNHGCDRLGHRVCCTGLVFAVCEDCE